VVAEHAGRLGGFFDGVIELSTLTHEIVVGIDDEKRGAVGGVRFRVHEILLLLELIQCIGTARNGIFRLSRGRTLAPLVRLRISRLFHGLPWLPRISAFGEKQMERAERTKSGFRFWPAHDRLSSLYSDVSLSMSSG
jgi:hypothetical protein